MTRLFRILLSVFLLLSLSVRVWGQDAAKGPPLKTLPATVTWLGNSFPGDRAMIEGVPNYVPLTLADIAVSRDGSVITAGTFNEAFTPSVVLKDGKFIGASPWQFESTAAGYDAGSDTFLAGVLASGAIPSGPVPLRTNGGRVDIPWYDTGNRDYWQHDIQREKGWGRKPRGFAFAGDLIYVSDESTGDIQVWSKSGKQWLTPLTVPGTTRLQVAGGRLWAIRGSSVVAIDTGAGKVVLTLPAADILTPVSLTADKWGRLLVGDAHPERRRIAIFDPATGKRVGTFGKIGGPWGASNVLGRAGNAVFEYPLGLGTDGVGNLYVGDAGGKWPQNGSITCYKPLPSGTKGWSVVPVWTARGSSWFDLAVPDPTDSSVWYSSLYKYKMDYGAAPGAGWKLTGTTLDRQRYPEDARVNIYNLGRYLRGIRVIEGKRFLFSGKLDVFRLGDTGAGDTAVPAATLLPRRATIDNGTLGWPPNAPDYPGFPAYNNETGHIWGDANRNGKYDAGEFKQFTRGEGHAGEWPHVLYLDDAAHVWMLPIAQGRRGFFYRMRGLVNDAPVWDDVNQRTEIAIPTGDGIGQISYVCISESNGDLMVLSRRDGRSDLSLTCYGWWRDAAISGRGSEAQVRYRIDGIAAGAALRTDQGYEGDYLGGMAAKNEYLFLADAMGAGIRVYRADTGAAVGRIDAGALGYKQPMDSPEGLVVATRGTGKALEYLIMRDRWLTNMTLILRWKP